MNKNTKLLLEASRASDQDRLLELLKNKDVYINETDKYTMTPFHYAVQRQFQKIVHELSRRPEIDLNI